MKGQHLGTNWYSVTIRRLDPYGVHASLPGERSVGRSRESPKTVPLPFDSQPRKNAES
jgi:hypothetical protein